MDNAVIIALVGLLFFGPWLFRRLWASTMRNTVHKARNERAQELCDHVLRFAVPDVHPRAVVDAIVSEAGFATEKSLKHAVSITGWDDGHIWFEFTNRFNLAAPGFTSLLTVEDGRDGDGTSGEYQVAEAYQFDGRAAGVEELARTEATIRKFVQWKFPDTRILP